MLGFIIRTAGVHKLLVTDAFKIPSKYVQSCVTGLQESTRGIRNLKWFKTSDFGNYDIIKQTGTVLSSTRSIPETIQTPPYYKQLPQYDSTDIDIKSTFEIEQMKKACSLAKGTLNYAKSLVKVGLTTEELDKLVHDYIINHGAYPSPLYYKGFPKSICTSVNNVVCHGIPDDRQLKDGDIINIDVTVFLNGFHGDVSETLLVGNVDNKGRKLVEVTKSCLDSAIAICRPGRPFNHIGTVIETLAKKQGFQVVPAFTGHGIGSYFHGAPDIYHFKNKLPGRMQPGMTFTIEPAISQGSERCVILEDGWTAITLDGSRAAQFEHTVLITNDGVEILTE